MKNNSTQTIFPILIGISIGVLIGAWLLFFQPITPWSMLAMALLCVFIAWWQTPCIRTLLKTSQPTTSQQPRFPCFKRWLLRLLGYGVLLIGLVIGEAVWWVKQPVVMNERYFALTDGDNKKEKLQALPLDYALKKILWQLGIASLPDLVKIPAGEFIMGSDKDNDEQPIHSVTIAQAFLMSRHEITFAQYDYYVWSMQQYRQQHLNKSMTKEIEATLPTINYPDDEGWGRDTRPVINVSWEDAQGYANWLSTKTGQYCRLPSESEWEYAARAGTKTDYFWGDKASHEYANHGKEECCGGLVKGRDQWLNTAPVGSFPANDFSLYDMNGNVWEWVQDRYQGNYTDSPTDGSVWEKPATSGGRVLRGGSWYRFTDFLRASARGDSAPDNRSFNFGFRVVCAPPSAER